MGVNVYPQAVAPGQPDAGNTIHSDSITTPTTVTLTSGYYSIFMPLNLTTSPNAVGFYFPNLAYYGQVSGGPASSTIIKTTTTENVEFYPGTVTRIINSVATSGTLFYGDGIWIAAVGNGPTTTSVFTNSGNPADAWTTRTLPTGADMRCGAYGAGETQKYVLAWNTIQTSTDSITWTERTAATSSTMLAATHGNGQYLLSGQSGVGQISTDGITWTLITTPNNGNSQTNVAVYANSRYILGHGTGIITHSTDAITWTSVTLPGTTTGSVYGIAYGDSVYVAVTSQGLIYSSTDLITWTTRTSNTTNNLWGVVHDGNDFWAWGNGSSSLWNNLRTSTDGITWTRYYSNSSVSRLNCFVYADNKLVSLGSTLTAQILKDTSQESSFNIAKYNY